MMKSVSWARGSVVVVVVKSTDFCINILLVEVTSLVCGVVVLCQEGKT